MVDKSELRDSVSNHPTFNAIEFYAPCLGYETVNDLIKEIGSGEVLDIGSGLGGLAKSVYFKKLPCRIVSVDAWVGKNRCADKVRTREYVKSELREERKRQRLFKGRLSPNREEDIVAHVQKSHDESAVMGLSWALPFEDNAFDLILDNQAVSTHASRYEDENIATPIERERFKKSIEEMLRVLRLGGKIRIGDCWGYGWGKRDGRPISWKEQVLEELGLNFRLIKIMPKHPVFPLLLDSEEKLTVGVEIFKGQ